MCYDTVDNVPFEKAASVDDLRSNSDYEVAQIDDVFFDNGMDECDIETNMGDSFNHGRKDEKPSLAIKLLYYFLIFNVSVRSMQYLLTILRDEGVNVPSSAHELKKPLHKKKANVIVRTLKCGGTMAYMSIKANLLHCIQNNLLRFPDIYNSIQININADGLPLFRSSPVTLWPILFSLRSCTFSKPLPIGVYVGLHKPDFSGYIQ